MGGSKASAGQCILYCPSARAISRYCPGRRAISRYCPERWFSVIFWSTLWSNLSSLGYCNRNFNSLYSRPCDFYLWYWVFILNYHSKLLISLKCCYNHHFKVTIYNKECIWGKFLSTTKYRDTIVHQAWAA